MAWIKRRAICAACGDPGPVICHHMYGSAAKKKVRLATVIIGHAAVIGLCQECDGIVTIGSRRAFVDRFGPQNIIWSHQYDDYVSDTGYNFSDEVVDGIMLYE